MSDITYEWNSRKASENARKHGVSFDEAKSAFLDDETMYRCTLVNGLSVSWILRCIELVHR